MSLGLRRVMTGNVYRHADVDTGESVRSLCLDYWAGSVGDHGP